MSYTQELVRVLVDTLSRTTDAPVHLLAGHVPNLPFWIDEVNHALAVIAGYTDRFEKMVAAEEDFAFFDPDAAKRLKVGNYLNGSPRMAMNVGERSRLSRELVDAARRLIDRCAALELIKPLHAERLRNSIKVASRV